MNIDIQAEEFTPRRQTFSHIARRFGEDRPASRYEEATYDIQPTTNFHYRPTYSPEFELYDTARTKVVMADWYVFRDPRQFYYATYNISRAAMQQSFDDAMTFVDKRNLLGSVNAEWLAKVEWYLLPLRHVEWAANMNCQLIADWGYGAQITSASAFCGADRLGLGQIISRIGLLLGRGTDEKLVEAKRVFTADPDWQPLRRVVEDLLVVHDWFETYVAQLVVLDGLIYPLITEAFDKAGGPNGASSVSMLTGFMTDWFADNSRWTDAVLKAAAAESDANRELLSEWLSKWTARARDAIEPIARQVLGDLGAVAVRESEAALEARVTQFGLSIKLELAA